MMRFTHFVNVQYCRDEQVYKLCYGLLLQWWWHLPTVWLFITTVWQGWWGLHYSMTEVVRFTLQYVMDDEVYTAIWQGWWRLHFNMTGMMRFTLQCHRDDVYTLVWQGWWCLHFSMTGMMKFTHKMTGMMRCALRYDRGDEVYTQFVLTFSASGWHSRRCASNGFSCAGACCAPTWLSSRTPRRSPPTQSAGPSRYA